MLRHTGITTISLPITPGSCFTGPIPGPESPLISERIIFLLGLKKSWEALSLNECKDFIMMLVSLRQISSDYPRQYSAMLKDKSFIHISIEYDDEIQLSSEAQGRLRSDFTINSTHPLHREIMSQVRKCR